MHAWSVGDLLVHRFNEELGTGRVTAIDFFASGHPLVESLLAHFEEDPKGRVARLEVRLPRQRGMGLVAIYKDGPELEVVALDADGGARRDWADAFVHSAVRARRMAPDDVAAHDWATIVTRLSASLGPRRPQAIAAVVVRSQ